MPIKTKKHKIQYSCQSCGAISPRWIGRCYECNSWNSFIEEVVQPSTTQKNAGQKSNGAPISLSEISFSQKDRISVNSQEFNRVLGGGIVPGSVILIGGDPGIGKSTLMLQEAVNLASQKFPILYVTGEESAQQTKLRAQRLGLDSEFLFVLAETDLNNVCDAIKKLNPGLVIVDSIQTVFQPAYESSPGSISQVRECTLEFSNIAKKKNIAIFLIGHVTKEGFLAGPKVLEHMVDVVLHFEGDRDHFYRILRSIKNRFGSTREIAVFEMTESGLKEVTIPQLYSWRRERKTFLGLQLFVRSRAPGPCWSRFRH